MTSTTAAHFAPRRKLWSQCQKKTRYRSQHEASQGAMNVRRRGGPEVHSYYCGLCDGWHIAKGVGW